MDVRKYLNLLDIANQDHRDLVSKLAKAKARYDYLKERRHRQDPSLLESAKEFRDACNDIRRAGQDAKTSIIS